MINLGLYIENSKGQRAFVGDEVKLDLLVQGWMSKDKAYKITDIRVSGEVMLDGCIGQHINGIKDFKVIKG